MSFILDALKKSEAERQRQAGPTLLQVRVTPPRTRLPLWALLLTLLLLVNVVILAVMLLRRDDRQEPAPAIAAAPAAAPTVVAAPVATAPAAPPPAATVTIQPPAIATVIPPATFPTAGGDDATAPRVQNPGNPADFAPALPRNTAAEQAMLNEPEEQVPSLQELQASGVTVPDLQMSLHSYDANVARRYVWINSKPLREGEATADGVRVERIVPRGVVMSWRGRRFILPQGE